MAKKNRLHLPANVRRIPLPVLLAACFLLFSCILFAGDKFSAKKQAEDWVKELYTVNRQLDWDDWISEEPQVLYDKKFGNRVTDAGMEALLSHGLPYVILLQENGAPVERSHVTEITVKEVWEDGSEADAGSSQESPEESVTGASEKQKSFRYEVSLDVTLEKGISVLAPVVEQNYTGIVTLNRSRFFGWKMDGFTMK